MAGPHDVKSDPDYRRGQRDGRMDWRLSGDKAQAPANVSEAYRLGYEAGKRELRHDAFAAA